MNWRKKILEKSLLYLIIDRQVCKNIDLVEIVKEIKKLRPHIIQLRDKISPKREILKTVCSLLKILKKTEILFIINDYLDIAKLTEVDGLHLGQKDVSVEIARDILGKEKLIGFSCHSLEEVESALKKDIDYLGVGPFFRTSTKPLLKKTIDLDIIKTLNRIVKIPYFAIGGINKENINFLLEKGVRRIAVCSSVFKDKDPLEATRYFLKKLTRNDHN